MPATLGERHVLTGAPWTAQEGIKTEQIGPKDMSGGRVLTGNRQEEGKSPS